MEELTPFFKAFESRDETIGRGNYSPTQASSYQASTSMSTVTTLPWPTDAEATPKTGKASVWQWARRSKDRKCTF